MAIGFNKSIGIIIQPVPPEPTNSIDKIALENDNQITKSKITEAKNNHCTSLELSGLLIFQLPEEIAELLWLEKLILKNNKNLNQINSIKSLINLKTLDISDTQVIDLTPLTNLKSLEDLKINSGTDGYYLRKKSVRNYKQNYPNINFNLKDITPLSGLLKLKKLNLCGTNIQDLTPLINLSEIQELDLSLSSVTSISPLSSLKKLETIFLSGTQINNLNPLSVLYNLKSIDIPATQVIDISPLKYLEFLTDLVLFETKVSNIDALSQLKNLENLGCAATKITDLSALNGLKKLKWLDASFNSLTNIDVVSSLINLESLEFLQTNLTNLRAISKLKYLKRLYLGFNPLVDLNPLKEIILKGLPVYNEIYASKDKVNGIFVGNCPLDPVLIAAIEDGQETLNDYFIGERDQLFESRVLILGEPRAGKTTLRRKLKSVYELMPKPDESTKGFEIEVDPIKFRIEKNGKIQAGTMQIWDFGGQEYYRLLHQLFITEQSVYVIVVDTDRNKNEEEVDFWFETIQRLGKNKNGNYGAVILFQNAKTNRSGSDFLDLRRRYSFWKQPNEFVINLNSINKNDLNNFNSSELKKFIDFKSYLEDSFQSLNNFGIEMPKKWVKIKQELVKIEKENWITIERFYSICQDNEIENCDEQERLLSIFRSLGYILHYDYENLCGMVILNRDWIINALYSALDNEIIKDNKGWFKEEDTKKIWTEPQYRNRTSELIGVMQAFNLCFYNRETKKYIVPTLLPENLDDYPELDPKVCVRLLLKYDWMPKSVGTQLIVSLNEYIETRENGEQWIWRNGAILEGIALEYPKLRAKIINNWRENQIEILASGEKSEILIRIILNNWRQVNKPFDDKTEVSKIILCNCNSCLSNKRPFTFDYVDVINAIQRGDSLKCNKSGKSFLGEDIFKGLFDSEKMPKEIIDLISKDKIEEAFEKINKPTNSMILLKGRLNGVEMNYRMGEVTLECRSVERAKISKSFLEFMEL